MKRIWLTSAVAALAVGGVAALADLGPPQGFIPSRLVGGGATVATATTQGVFLFGTPAQPTGFIRGQTWSVEASNQTTVLDGTGTTAQNIAEDMSGTEAIQVNANGVAIDVESSSSGDEVGFFTGNNSFDLSSDPYCLFKFALDETTDIRFVVGVTSSTLATEVGSDDPGNVFLGLSYNTSQSDTTFVFQEHDGTTQARTSTAVNVDTSIHYLEIDASNNGAAVTLRMLDASFNEEASRTVVQIPTATTDLRVVWGFEPLAAASKSADFYWAQGFLRP